MAKTAAAKNQAAPVSAEDRKKANAEREAARRQTIEDAKVALEKAGMDANTELDLDQRKRAAEATAKKPGLAGKALQEFILNGATVKDQVQEAKGKREAKERAASTENRSRSNLTRSNDPEATELAKAAKALAPDVKSAFLPKDARAFIDEIQGKRAAADLLTRTVEVETEDKDGNKSVEKVERSISQAGLKRFAVENIKDTDEAKAVRQHLTALGSGTRLWGRKLGLMILAKIAAEKK